MDTNKQTKSLADIRDSGQFDFWRDNRLDQHFQMNGVELREKFRPWLSTKEDAWFNYYNTDMIVRAFLTAKDGISSVFEEDQYNQLYLALQPVVSERRMKDV